MASAGAKATGKARPAILQERYLTFDQGENCRRNRAKLPKPSVRRGRLHCVMRYRISRWAGRTFSLLAAVSFLLCAFSLAVLAHSSRDYLS